MQGQELDFDRPCGSLPFDPVIPSQAQVTASKSQKNLGTAVRAVLGSSCDILSANVSLSPGKDFPGPARLSLYLRMPFTSGDLRAQAAISVLVPTEQKERWVMGNAPRRFLLESREQQSESGSQLGDPGSASSTLTCAARGSALPGINSSLPPVLGGTPPAPSPGSEGVWKGVPGPLQNPPTQTLSTLGQLLQHFLRKKLQQPFSQTC